MKRIYIHTDMGIEKQCSCCGYFFPHDTDFFHSSGFKNNKRQLHSRCKVCYSQSYKGVA